MKRLLLPFMILSLFSLVALANSKDELKPFTSDGCSSFPDGTLKQKQLWLSCCVAHDKAYWMGGTYEERLQADKALKVCVEQVGEKTIAKLMLAGVRVGGSPYWPTDFRWGYGWDYTRGYQKLTQKELEKAKKLLADYDSSEREKSK
ncbi:FAD-binding oxidoreductase [Aliikangiella coralliicola]|nr:FAD-binding oxidoreductase [Aliikangiella coralliicola]